MQVWLITVGEPLPTDSANARLLRTGIIAGLLAGRKHDVVWWSSTFDHFTKRQRFKESTTLQFKDYAKLLLLHGPAYRSNVSVSRVLNHIVIAREFTRRAERESKPDIILCSFPTIELSAAAVEYGHRHRVPVVLDIRDLWPDIFLELAPTPLRSLARLALTPLFRLTRKACLGASAIIGINPDFTEWGVRNAGRARGALDATFPLAYKEQAPPAHAIHAARQRWQERGLSSSSFIACFFGTIGRQFELDTVIEAARRLGSRRPDMVFVLCGDGDRLSQYRELARDCPNVIFPGWVDHADIWTLMRMAAVGLAPYTSEDSFTSSLPNKAIEYLSAGLPLVSSLRGALQQLLMNYNCGLSYKNRDVEDCVRALDWLYTDPVLRRQMADNALAVFRERFVAERVYGDLIEHLGQVRDAHMKKMSSI